MKKFFLIILLAGCKMYETFPDYPTNSIDSCIVFFYRDAKVGGSSVTFQMYDQGAWIGALRSGAYFVYEAAPGFHEFTVRGEVRSTRSIQCKPGQTYYFRSEAQTGYFSAHATLKMENEDGPAAVGYMKYTVPKKTGKYSVDPNYVPGQYTAKPKKKKEKPFSAPASTSNPTTLPSTTQKIGIP